MGKREDFIVFLFLCTFYLCIRRFIKNTSYKRFRLHYDTRDISFLL